MKSISPFLFFITCYFFSSLLSGQSYDYATPTKTIVLPPILREISDIDVVNANTVVCVQDEKGILFQYNLKKGIIASQDSFYLDGDYEGVAKAGKDIFVLRGDGTILEIKNAIKGKGQTKLYTTNIPAINNEGLCYDAYSHCLLIACKSRTKIDSIGRDKRMIYAFDLKTKKLKSDPILEMNTVEIKNYLINKYGISDTVGFNLKFKPSAIAIHPIDKKLYLLSAAGYLLCVFNNGVFESAEMLDPALFNKAEGITFLKNGDMIVSNEGKQGSATLLLFKKRK